MQLSEMFRTEPSFRTSLSKRIRVLKTFILSRSCVCVWNRICQCSRLHNQEWYQQMGLCEDYRYRISSWP